MRIVSVFAICVASLMPVVSVVVLNVVGENLQLRLGFVALFTVAFCVLYSLFTGPKKTELLAASAA